MDPYELEERKHLAQEDVDKLKQDLPRIELEVLSGDEDRPSQAERDSEPGEPSNPVKSADP